MLDLPIPGRPRRDVREVEVATARPEPKSPARTIDLMEIKRGNRRMRLPPSRIKSGIRPGGLYAYPREKSISHFKDQIRQLTRRRAPVSTRELILQVNPVLRGWGHYYKRAHVRKLFNRLDRWLVQRIWSHRFGRWRCRGWQTLSRGKLYGEYGLVNLVGMIPSIAARRTAAS